MAGEGPRAASVQGVKRSDLAETDGDLSYQVRAVQRALRILYSFSREKQEFSLGDMAELLGVHKSTALRLLSTLESARFVSHDSARGVYRLGAATVELGGVYLAGIPVEQLAFPYLQQLASDTGLTVNLGVLDGTSVIVLASVEGAELFAVRSSTGVRNRVIQSSIGKAILAEMSDDELRTLFGKNERIIEAASATRKLGFATDDEETAPGIRCVGVSIRSKPGTVRAGLSISGLATSLGDKEVRVLAGRLRVTADEIGRGLSA
jgi:DNA-binding IclR family transcriptional regulator